MAPELHQLKFAVGAVGSDLLAWRDEALGSGRWSAGQMKADVDGRAHHRLTALLQDIDPQIPVISEESLESQRNSRPARYFLIDPIDGTASYVNGFDGFVTQVAYMEAGVPLLAAIYAPLLDETYTAARGRGAWRNGIPLPPRSGTQGLRLIDNYPEPRGFAASVYDMLGCTGYVECGSISLKICRVAEGSAELFLKDVTVRDWDLGAPHLVLQEAGGDLGRLDGSSIPYDGPYAHRGLIAAYDPGLVSTLAVRLQDLPESSPP